MRVKNETSRWCCFSSSTTRLLEVRRRRCRARRGPRGRPPGRRAPAPARSRRAARRTSWSLNRYCSSRSKSSRLAPGAAVRMIAPPPCRSSPLGLAAQALALLVVEALGDADALAGRRVDHVAPGDGELHRQPRALGLQRVLDDLHDDLLAGLEQVGDLLAAARGRARGAASRRRAGRSRRRAGSRSCRGRCRRTRPPGRAGRCRPCPCRCCRRWSGCRGARGRARRRGIPRRGSPCGDRARARAWWRRPACRSPRAARRGSPRGRR